MKAYVIGYKRNPGHGGTVFEVFVGDADSKVLVKHSKSIKKAEALFEEEKKKAIDAISAYLLGL